MPRSTRGPLVLLGLYAALCVVLLAFRLSSAFSNGAWAQTTGPEGVHANIVLRVAAGAAPYHDLNTDATPALYNLAFYALYGWVAAWIESGPRVLFILRLLTLAFGVAAIAALALIARGERQSSRPYSWTVASMIAVASMASPFTGWWLLTIRPDIAAFACELAGVALARSALHRHSDGRLIVSGVAFAAAFAFKQNTIGMAAATLLFLAYRRRWRPLVAIAGIFGATALAIGALAGPYYAAHTLMAPAVTPFSGTGFRYVLGDVLRVGGPAFLALALSTTRGKRRAEDLPLWLPVVVTVVLALPQLARYGAGRNYLIAAVALASVIAWTRVLGTSPMACWRRRAVLATLAAQAMLAAAYLPPFNQGTLRLPLPGNRPAAYARLAASAERPMLVSDGWAGLPWNAGHAGVEVLDDTLYPFVRDAGQLTDTIESRIMRCHYRTLVLSEGPLLSAAQRAGYAAVAPLSGGLAWLTATCQP